MLFEFDIEFDEHGNSPSILSHDGNFYMLKKVWICACCNSPIVDTYIHPAKIYDGNHYHLMCIRNMFRKSPLERMDGKDRAAKIIVRLSKNKVLSPDKCYEIDRRMMGKCNKGWRGVSFTGMEFGVLNGQSLIDSANFIDRMLLLDFWEKASETKFNYAEFELALLLTLLGDKNGIANATRRNASIVRGRKKVNPGNNSKHTRRRA